jgi:hypothetical protein
MNLEIVQFRLLQGEASVWLNPDEIASVVEYPEGKVHERAWSDVCLKNGEHFEVASSVSARLKELSGLASKKDG